MPQAGEDAPLAPGAGAGGEGAEAPVPGLGKDKLAPFL